MKMNTNNKKIAGIAFLVTPLLFSYDYKSQAGQDKYIHEQFFKNKKNGFYVDIGAHDGITGSNTYFFEKELGWQGMCFEPLTHLYEKLKQCRNALCINACVADHDGSVQFVHVDSIDEMLSGMLQTFDERMMNIVLRDLDTYGGKIKIIDLPCVKLEHALAQYGMPHIDLLSLDTEGSEMQILRSIDFSKVIIDVITVENNYREESLREFLRSKGYKYITSLWPDDVFVRSDFKY